MLSAPAIDAILQAEDVEGLLELGAPRDEYFHEATMIESGIDELMPDNVTENRIYALVARVWENSFDLSREDIAKRSLVLQRVAQRIWESCLG